MNNGRLTLQFSHEFRIFSENSGDTRLNSLNLHPYNLANRLADKMDEIVVELNQGALYQPFTRT